MSKTRVDSDVLEQAAHILNAARASVKELCEQLDVSEYPYWDNVTEGEFWEFINALPKRMQDSVIN